MESIMAACSVSVSKQPLSTPTRSEEHTSELQSRLHLVCRLLLEKKKQQHDDFDRPYDSHDLVPRHTHHLRHPALPRANPNELRAHKLTTEHHNRHHPESVIDQLI